MSSSKTFCVLPWMHLASFPVGDIRLCCVASESVRESDCTTALANDTDWQEIWNGEYLRDVRMKMLAGEKVRACSHCYDEEKFGKPSLRESHNADWMNRRAELVKARIKESTLNEGRVSDPPISFDFRLSNVCNLKCQMCSPSNSNQLFEEFKIFSEDPTLADLFKDSPDNLANFGSRTKENGVKSIRPQLSLIENLYLTGGEPTVVSKNIEILEDIVNQGRAHLVDLQISTNCVSYNERFVNAALKFRNFTVACSIDGIGAVNNYVRYPSRWENVSAVFKKYLEIPSSNIEICLTPLVQAYTVCGLPELLDWTFEQAHLHNKAIGVYPMMIHYPEFLKGSALPEKISGRGAAQLEAWMIANPDKSYIRAHLKPLVEPLRGKSSEEQRRNFLRYTNRFDENRKTSVYSILPELNV